MSGLLGDSALFELPAGAGELQYNAVNPNNPGVVTLSRVVSGTSTTVLTLTNSLGDFSFTGSGFFQTAGGWFKLNTTVAAQNLTIYFMDSLAI